MSSTDGVLLLDQYDEAADMLRDSFRRAGFTGPVVALCEDAVLPEDVWSVFRLAATDATDAAFPGAVREATGPDDSQARAYRLAHAGWTPGAGRRFNQIEAPDFWEIVADGVSGRVLDRGRLRARIFYARTEASRIVSDVDWLDEGGTVRFTDHYDLRGQLCARTTFNERGERFCRSWFDGQGRERVVENYVTRDVVVTRDGAIRRFDGRTDLAVAMLRELGVEGQRIFYNSLSTPLFVSERLQASPDGNVLFWQEAPRPDIPGNMRMILDGRSRTTSVLVQRADSCERLLSLGASADYVRPFGFAYGFVRENAASDDVLICTNSDRIEAVEEVVRGLPEMTFHVAAVTEMSSKLLALGAEPNVRLYPVASRDTLTRLFDLCDWYLDINHGGEIVDAVRRAFLHDQLILGFSTTLHRPRYVSPAHVLADAQSLVSLMRELRASQAELRRHLELQRKAAMTERPEAYRRLFAGAS
ncbi:accessory Sec system glycosylation chaperone GtfB [bacterium]|nr:accessory Sec system glycosylation chaperone GtfB [bacterium]